LIYTDYLLQSAKILPKLLRVEDPYPRTRLRKKENLIYKTSLTNVFSDTKYPLQWQDWLLVTYISQILDAVPKRHSSSDVDRCGNTVITSL